nr:immunoglobulin heavy chain junction region [Mus musculus]
CTRGGLLRWPFDYW